MLLDEDRRSESKVFFASLARKTIDVVVTLPTILVEGRIHTKTANDPQTYLSLEAGTVLSPHAVRRSKMTPVKAAGWRAPCPDQQGGTSSISFK